MKLLLIGTDAGADLARLLEGHDVHLERAGRVAVALERLLVDTVDCALLTVPAPATADLDLVERVVRAALQTPVVVLAGDPEDGFDFAAQALDAGAQDVLALGGLSGGELMRAVRHAIARHRLLVRLAHRALHDPLTRLPNRILFLDRLRQSLRRTARTQTCLAVLFFDLDEFKLVNDRDGHEAGDALLMGVAHALEATLRGGDTAARMGGDEFVALCEDVRGEKEARRIAARLLRRLPGPASMGVAVAHGEDLDPKAVVRAADAAMYRAKRAGGASYAMADGSAPIGV
jgi:diguanylate cyclase (GGDEF)-like protein